MNPNFFFPPQRQQSQPDRPLLSPLSIPQNPFPPGFRQLSPASPDSRSASPLESPLGGDPFPYSTSPQQQQQHGQGLQNLLQSQSVQSSQSQSQQDEELSSDQIRFYLSQPALLAALPESHPLKCALRQVDPLINSTALSAPPSLHPHSFHSNRALNPTSAPPSITLSPADEPCADPFPLAKYDHPQSFSNDPPFNVTSATSNAFSNSSPPFPPGSSPSASGSSPGSASPNVGGNGGRESTSSHSGGRQVQSLLFCPCMDKTLEVFWHGEARRAVDGTSRDARNAAPHPDNRTLFFLAGSYNKVYKGSNEVYPWTGGHGNDWLKGQRQTCLCGFDFLMKDHTSSPDRGASYKRPATMRDHLANCEAMPDTSPLKILCRLQRDATRARSAAKRDGKRNRSSDSRLSGSDFSGLIRLSPNSSLDLSANASWRSSRRYSGASETSLSDREYSKSPVESRVSLDLPPPAGPIPSPIQQEQVSNKPIHQQEGSL